MLKTGQKYWLTITAIPAAQQINVSLPDEIKSKLQSDISKELPDHNLDIIITKDVRQL